MKPFLDTVKYVRSRYPSLREISDVYQTALEHHDEYTSVAEEGFSDEMSKRLSTLHNVSMAEMNYIHEQKDSIWREQMKNWIDGHIEAHEQILQHLKSARERFL